MNDLTLPASPCGDMKNEAVCVGFTKHEKAALMIAQGLVSKYNLSSPADQKIIAKLSYELAAEILNQF